MSRILVTRPEPGASATARRLHALKHEPVLLPLTAIRPVDMPDIPDPGRFDAVLSTSANAIRHAPARLVGDLASTPLLAVGERTAEVARAAGFARVDAAEGDAASLASLVAVRFTPGSRLLYLAGADRGDVLEDRLRAQGHVVETLPTYAAPEIDYSDAALEQALAGVPIAFALVYSARAGALLAALVEREVASRCLRHTTFAAISEQAAAPFASLGTGRVEVARTATEDALFALLPRH